VFYSCCCPGCGITAGSTELERGADAGSSRGAAIRIQLAPRSRHRSRCWFRQRFSCLDLIESLLVSEGVTQGLKAATRRERPDGSSHNSFPSGHAADTFAFATALERQLGWRGAVPAYVVASYVAISRVPANRHWLSDAVFGSAVGIIAGRTVTRHGREFPVSLVIVPGGTAVVWTPFRARPQSSS
jgi:hypothetical protein